MTRKKHNTMDVKDFNRQQLLSELKHEGKILNLHQGYVELISEKTIRSLNKWLRQKTIVTKDDIDRKVVQELQKYHKDLAYLYQNQNKII